MTVLPWRSRFVYGASAPLEDWTTRLSTRPWQRTTNTIGGSRTSAAGVPAAYVARRDYNLRLPLRLYETELANFSALLEWAQGADSFLWYPDASIPAVSFEVYLEGPLAGEKWEESRLSEFPLVSEVSIVLRRVDGYAWGLDFFAC